MAVSLGLVFGAVSPASAEATGNWETQSDGVAGVSAHGYWEYYDGTIAPCYVNGYITDTRADGHAPAVQVHVIPDQQTLDGDYYRIIRNTGGNGSTRFFERTYDGILRSPGWEGGSVWIREVLTEQGEITGPKGDWHLLCDGFGY